jgi:hypothetical protein
MVDSSGARTGSSPTIWMASSIICKPSEVAPVCKATPERMNRSMGQKIGGVLSP